MLLTLPTIIFQAPPDGWQVPADGATMTKPPSPLVSAKTSKVPFSPGLLASLVLPGTSPSMR